MRASSSDSMKEGFYRLNLLPTKKNSTFHILENEESFNTSYISIYFCWRSFVNFPEISQKSYNLNEITYPKSKALYKQPKIIEECLDFFSIFLSLCKAYKAKTFERKAHIISFHKILILRCPGERTIDKACLIVKLHTRIIASLENACTVLNNIRPNWKVRKQIHLHICK